MDEVNCRKVNNLISAYIDGELAGVEQLEIRQHLRGCNECSDEYESLLLTKRLLANVTFREPRPELEERILHRLSTENGVITSRFNWRVFWTMMTYSQRLRFSAMCATFSLAALCLSIISFAPSEQTPGMTANIGRAELMPAASYLPADASSVPMSIPLRDYLTAHRAWEDAQATSGPTLVPANISLLGPSLSASGFEERP